MTIRDYEKLAMRTSPEGHDRVLNGCLGLIGESGEIVDIAKKWKFQSGENAEIPRDRLIDECGDVLWYCAELCKGLHIELERVARQTEDIACAMSGMFYHDAYLLSRRCADIYELYYAADGEYQRPRAKIVRRDGSRARVIETERPARIAYPAELKDGDDFLLYDTVTLDIGVVFMRVKQILRIFADCGIGEAMERNIEKLKKRYPDGFDPERSLHRSE